MSRCFPFPPPGYILNGIRDESVIKSIKEVEEKAKKEQRRKEKKEKREKKKEKREKKEKKRKEREEKEVEFENRSHKRLRKEEEGAKVDQNHKVERKETEIECLEKSTKDDQNHKETEMECLEKSSLTIERELLHSTSQNSCDSTLDSFELLPKQKEKNQLLLNGKHNNNNDDSESVIRIRLPIRRHKDPELMKTTNKDQQKPYLSQRPTQPVNQNPCSTSAPEHGSKPCEVPTSQQPSSLCSICPPSLAIQFLNVVENWIPNTTERRLELFTNSKDEECWWLSKKPSNHKFSKQVNIEIKEVISCSMAWPCARLLPEADVHALPYTIPF